MPTITRSPIIKGVIVLIEMLEFIVFGYLLAAARSFFHDSWWLVLFIFVNLAHIVTFWEAMDHMLHNKYKATAIVIISLILEEVAALIFGHMTLAPLLHH
ncbi:MAG: hypothetical protein E7328_04160 [Clostridiales bacterium]|nr:hypothetical protein [Clostridiales bacterium]